jgi:hypothetical protein
MVRSFAALALAVVVATGVGCAGVAAPVHGSLFTDVKYPAGVTSNSGSTKTGQAKATSYLGIVALGDASVEAAAKAGGITKVHHVDAHAKSILGIIGWYTITVYGE